MKLHLGCGKRYIPGFVHIDIDNSNEQLDHVHSIDTLPMIETDSCDLIYCSHAFEYFDAGLPRTPPKDTVACAVLREWKRCLKPGGTLRLAVPNFKSLVRVYDETGDIRSVLGPIFGKWTISRGTIWHKTSYDAQSLTRMLRAAGFQNIREWDWRHTEHAEIDDHSQAYVPHMEKDTGIHVSLNVEADVPGGENIKICVTGGAGFIGSHLARRLRSEGHYVVCADWKHNEFMEASEFCDEFMLMDLRDAENCSRCIEGCDEVYHLAADMGGMGFIQSNHSTILYNNTMIDFNVVHACREHGVGMLFYSSSACIYPEHLQERTRDVSLREDDAWPAQPQDAYGLEKLVTEELMRYYGDECDTRMRCARFHNIYGPRGTWCGGREKAPAAFLRKALTCEDRVEMWGDGEQTRSFCYIDDCIEGILRISRSHVFAAAESGKRRARDDERYDEARVVVRGQGCPH